MNSSSREADYAPKQEDKSTTSDGKISKNISSTTSWSRLKDPRIVRVSRAFGGKDRHSKVFTVRGLRDRRVRLSVPTAIQLYDLQDRLGLNQPSKVVDWLLNAAKHEIDELPPLQLPPAGNFSQFHHQSMASHVSHEVNAANSQSVDRTEGHVNWNDHLELSNYYGNTDGNLMRDHMKSKELVEESEGIDREELTKRKQDHNDAYSSTSNNFLARANVQSGMLNNAIPIQNSSFLRWDPSNLSLSHTDQDHLHHNYNVVPVLPSTSLSTPISGSQFVLYQPGVEFDSKQMINFQMLSSASTSQNSTFSNIPPAFTPPLYSLNQAAAMRPFHLSMNPNYDSTESAPNKDS